MYALFDQLFPRQQELHADLEVAILDRVTESVDLGPYALRVDQKVVIYDRIYEAHRLRRVRTGFAHPTPA
jgi:hypothetical protein